MIAKVWIVILNYEGGPSDKMCQWLMMVPQMSRFAHHIIMEILLVNFCIYFPLSFLVMNLHQIAHVKDVLHHFDHLLITKPSSRFDGELI